MRIRPSRKTARVLETERYGSCRREDEAQGTRIACWPFGRVIESAGPTACTGDRRKILRFKLCCTLDIGTSVTLRRKERCHVPPSTMSETLPVEITIPCKARPAHTRCQPPAADEDDLRSAEEPMRDTNLQLRTYPVILTSSAHDGALTDSFAPLCETRIGPVDVGASASSRFCDTAWLTSPVI